MAASGYIEGKNVVYDFNNAKGDAALLQKMAQKVAQDRPDVIVTSSTTATVPVTKTSAPANIPVVFLSSGNPLVLVKSYASSENNLTGISTSVIDLTAKRVELLKDLAPAIRRLISVNNPEGPNYEDHLRAMREAAKKFALEIVQVNVTTADELVNKSSELLTRKMGDAIAYPPDARVNAAHKRLSPHVNRERLPSIAANVGNVHDGALATYSADYFALGQQGALLVDKILKGAKPENLPIEQPAKLNFVLNMKTAKAIGLKIPKEILVRVDEMIE
jgi:putative ABC transport system substrate-binding protein